MTISDFLSRHAGHDVPSPNEVIPISFQIQELLNNTEKMANIIEALKDLDRLNTMANIPAKKAPSPVKRVTRRIAQPGEEAPIWPLTGETRRPEHVPQPVQRQIQLHKHVVQVDVHVSTETPNLRFLLNHKFQMKLWIEKDILLLRKIQFQENREYLNLLSKIANLWYLNHNSYP